MNYKKTLAVLLGILLALIMFTTVMLIHKSNMQEPTLGYLNISCNGKDISNTFKKGDTFSCDLLNSQFEITIKKINDDKIKLQADKYGLAVEKNKKIDLNEKVKSFEVYKDRKIILKLQATDISSTIEITYQNKKMD